MAIVHAHIRARLSPKIQALPVARRESKAPEVIVAGELEELAGIPADACRKRYLRRLSAAPHCCAGARRVYNLVAREFRCEMLCCERRWESSNLSGVAARAEEGHLLVGAAVARNTKELPEAGRRGRRRRERLPVLHNLCNMLAPGLERLVGRAVGDLCNSQEREKGGGVMKLEHASNSSDLECRQRLTEFSQKLRYQNTAALANPARSKLPKLELTCGQPPYEGSPAHGGGK